MQKYIALLRGINVSGQKKIKMAELREHLVKLNFKDIETYIQSGNIVFSYREEDLLKLGQMISQNIKDNYGFDVVTIVVKPAYFQECANQNPFHEHSELEGNKCFLTLLSDFPSPERVTIFNQLDYTPDLFQLEAKSLYFYCPNGAGRSKLSNNLIESKLKVSATSRNFNTVRKLLEMSLS